MKKTALFSLFIAAIAYSGCSPSSFATVGNNGWKVTLYHYTNDVKVKEDGRDMPIIEAYGGHKKAGYAAYTSVRQSNGTYLYTSGIQLDKASDTHNITLMQGDKNVTVTVTRKSAPFIDVTAALGESKTMSYDDLQKEFVKQQTKKRK